MAKNTFNENETFEKESFNQLLPKKEKKANAVSITGDNDFGGGLLTAQTTIPVQSSTQVSRGRPVKIKDTRFKVSVPTKISPATQVKLDCLKDYVTEFSSISGRISFDKYIDTLAEAYINNKLGVAKSENLRNEIEQAMNELLQ